MALKIKGKCKGEISCKRMYLGVTFVLTCDECGHKWEIVSGYPDHYYVSYPTMNGIEEFTIQCDCGNEFTEKFKVIVKVKPVK